jgi:hypothetical protein
VLRRLGDNTYIREDIGRGVMVLSTDTWTIVIEENGLILYNFYGDRSVGQISPGENARTDEAREAAVQAVDALLTALKIKVCNAPRILDTWLSEVMMSKRRARTWQFVADLPLNSRPEWYWS